VILFFVFIVIVINACNNSAESPILQINGKTNINTYVDGFQISGFSFSKAATIVYPNSQNIIPDIVALVHIVDGNVVGVFFDSGKSLKPSFKLIKQFNNIDSAQTFFNTLSEIQDTNFEILAIPVKANQIWGVKTVDDKYGKILILNSYAFEDNSDPSSSRLYGEARFKWGYQPDGSTKF